MAQQYNARNPSIKRILKEYEDFEREKPLGIAVQFNQDDIYEWHFTISGEPGTEFEGGLYHGKVILPPEYPFKPPTVIMLNESGRYEIGKSICLSATEYHPESWSAAWSIQTLLESIRGFMKSPADGAIGAIDSSKEDRMNLARLSQTFVCKECGMDHREVSKLQAFVDFGKKNVSESVSQHTEKATAEKEEAQQQNVSQEVADESLLIHRNVPAVQQQEQRTENENGEGQMEKDKESDVLSEQKADETAQNEERPEKKKPIVRTRKSKAEQVVDKLIIIVACLLGILIIYDKSVKYLQN